MVRIKSLTVSRFRRFTELTIIGIPSTAKMVVLVGPNGSGKSAIFDAINTWYRRNNSQYGFSDDNLYFFKSLSSLPESGTSMPEVVFYDPAPSIPGLIHVRSAYRLDADFTLSHLSSMKDRELQPRVMRLIDQDQSVSLNYQLLVSDVLSEFFDTDSEKSVKEFWEGLIGALRKRVQTIFPDLVLRSLGRPLVDGSFYFDKGDAKNFQYKNLSGGEKSVFDILLDLHMAFRIRSDRIYLIDEPEIHTNAKIQRDLMFQMYDVMPDDAQLWIATHSLGMLNAAKKLSIDRPGTVVF